MKTKLLKKVRKNFQIVEYKEWTDMFGEKWGDSFQVEYKDSCVKRYYYDTNIPKKHPDNLTRAKAFSKAYTRLTEEIYKRHATKKHQAKKKHIPSEKVIWPPKDGWWITEEISPKEKGI